MEILYPSMIFYDPCQKKCKIYIHETVTNNELKKVEFKLKMDNKNNSNESKLILILDALNTGVTADVDTIRKLQKNIIKRVGIPNSSTKKICRGCN